MATLRITVTFDGRDPGTVPARLAELAGQLRDALGTDRRLTRLAALHLPGSAPAPGPPEPPGAAGPGDPGPRDADPIFRLSLPDGDAAGEVIAALGGWHMRHPDAILAIKADGPRGGVSLRLDGWSAVAFAAAVARIREHLLGTSGGEPR